MHNSISTFLNRKSCFAALGHTALLAMLVWLPQTAAFAEDSATSSAAVAASVTVAAVETQDFVARTAISGSVIALNSVSVVPQISGYPVIMLAVEVGDTVAKGDVLAQLDSAALTAQLAQVDAQIDTAQSSISQAESQIASATAQADEAATTLARTQALVKGGSVAQSVLDQAQAASRTSVASLNQAQDGLASARAQLRQVQAQRAVAQLALDHTKLIATVDGIIAARNIDLGDVAGVGDAPAFVIFENAALEIRADVVETALGNVSKDDTVSLSIAGLPALSGHVRRIAPTVDAATRLGTVHITPETSQGLRAGLYAGGWIITETKTGLAVPTTAVQTDPTGAFVFVVTNGVLAKTRVEARSDMARKPRNSLWSDRRTDCCGPRRWLFCGRRSRDANKRHDTNR